MRITDPKAIRALTHPLRLDLIELLGAISPATAAHCARILGQSQATCSFHLRQLAKYGFVEDAGPGSDRRERLWRVTDRHITVRDDDTDPIIAGEYRQVAVAREVERISEYLQRRDSEPDEWRKAAGLHSATLTLTAEEAASLREAWRQAIAPFVARAETEGLQAGPGQRYVRFFMASFPLLDLDLGE